MRTTRHLARAAALVAVAALGIGTSSAAYADQPADKGARQEQAGPNHAEADHQAHGKGQARGKGDPSSAPAGQASTNHSCDGSHRSDTGHGANTDGPTNPYHNTCDEDVASDNGHGRGKASGRPAAGTVGNADDKNPPGQAPGPQDRNNGYECDGNNGIAKGNPAHTGCTAPRAIAQPAAKVTCPGGVMAVDANRDGALTDADCTEVKPPVAERREVICPGGTVMTRDVNRDGAVTNADCAQVLGNRVVKPVARPVVPAAVAGARLDQRPLAVGGVTLPVTGGDVRALLAYAGMLVAAGSVLLTSGSRIDATG